MADFLAFGFGAARGPISCAPTVSQHAMDVRTGWLGKFFARMPLPSSDPVEQGYAVFLVNANGKSAGILTPAKGGFRFAANAARFETHDGRVFATRNEAEQGLSLGLPDDVTLTFTFLPQP